MASSPAFQMLIIDLDGTLVDTRKDITFSLNHTLQHFQFSPIPDDIIAEYIGTGITPLLKEKIAEQQLPQVLEHFEKTYISHIAEKSLPYPGWLEIFSQYPEKKFVVLTNKIQLFTDALLEKLSLKQYLVAAYGREAFPERKPSALPVKKILEIHNTLPEQALIVGDMPADILCGQNAGIQTCAALYGFGKEDVLRELQPTYCIHRPLDLLPYL